MFWGAVKGLDTLKDVAKIDVEGLARYYNLASREGRPLCRELVVDDVIQVRAVSKRKVKGLNNLARS